VFQALTENKPKKEVEPTLGSTSSPAYFSELDTFVIISFLRLVSYKLAELIATYKTS